jgi:two-component system, NarL family, response regulator LiaR
MGEKITAVIVDDHEVVRNGVRTYLNTLPEFEVVGEAATGEEAIQLVEKLTPDVVLMDMILPGMGGVEATRQIKAISSRTNVVVLTSYHDDELIFPALRAGATGYILKDTRMANVADALRKAAQGEVTLHPYVATRLIQEVQSDKASRPDPFAELTEREMDVLKLIANGLSNADIADQLIISENTVKSHVSNILSKLHLEDRTQAAVLAWQQGIVRRV